MDNVTGCVINHKENMVLNLEIRPILEEVKAMDSWGVGGSCMSFILSLDTMWFRVI